jgi:L-asparaginase/Glu-tRNA(Gln) amidotransferase subunit D
MASSRTRRRSLVDTEIVYSIYSENLTPKNWTELAQTVAKRIEAGVDGVVGAHGTDTMAYTSAALSFALQNLPVPVLLVGAQRSSDRPSSDASTNLIGAVKAAGEGPFAEVGLAMHQTTSDTAIIVHRGVKVRKCHTSRRDTFNPSKVPHRQVQYLKLPLETTSTNAATQTKTGPQTRILRQSCPHKIQSRT